MPYFNAKNPAVMDVILDNDVLTWNTVSCCRQNVLDDEDAPMYGVESVIKYLCTTEGK